MNDNNSLAHTTWNCKYHIVFAPKYRRKVLLQENRVEMGKILRELRLEREKNRDRNLCAHVCRDTAKDERIQRHGIPQRKK